MQYDPESDHEKHERWRADVREMVKSVKKHKRNMGLDLIGGIAIAVAGFAGTKATAALCSAIGGMFVILCALYFTTRDKIAEVRKLEGKLDREELRNRIREQMAKLLEQGRVLLNLHKMVEELNTPDYRLSRDDDSDLMRNCKEWDKETLRFLSENFGESYAVRYRDEIGIQIPDDISPRGKEDITARLLYVRRFRLMEFLQTESCWPLKIRPASQAADTVNA